jgi:hypothetical protein
LWRQAAEIRGQWLAVGVSVEPADRSATEEAIASIYARHRRARPSFRWVESPRAALPHLDGLPTHETLRAWVSDRRPPGRPPVASDIAAGLSHLRSVLMEGAVEPTAGPPTMKRPKDKPWPRLPADQAITAGLPVLEIVRQGVRESLFRSLAKGIYLPIRQALVRDLSLPPHDGAAAALPIGWYGQQDAAWIGYVDVLRRLGLVPTTHGPEFDTWAALARAGGWWWPGEDCCVVSERPVVLRTEPVPGAWHDEVRLRSDPGKPAVEYRDGWSI